MMFWDASAIIPMFVEGPQTEVIRLISERDGDLVAWWGSPVECCSAFARLRREGFLTTTDEDHMREMLSLLSETWTEIQPGIDIRETAQRLLLSHPLRTADSLQLAAALVWAGKRPRSNYFVCLDQRLRMAARNEGFSLLPEE